MRTAELLVALQSLSSDALVGFIAYLVADIVGSLVGSFTVIAALLVIRSAVLRHHAREIEWQSELLR